MADSWCIVLAATLPREAARDLEASAFGPFTVVMADGAWASGAGEAGPAALLLDAAALGTGGEGLDIGRTVAGSDLLDAAGNAIALLVVGDVAPAASVAWLQAGAQDILSFDDLRAASMPRRVRAAIERCRLLGAARRSYATDLATGLPHRQQLIEHTSQLLAIREREPAPMAMLVLRLEGLVAAAAAHSVAADVLRRKVAVRLRAGVRGSDVVAVLGSDSFAVLLASILAPADAQRVGAKLTHALLQPFKVGGEDLVLAVALGIAQYPDDGLQPEALLHSATVAAAVAALQGRVGMANFREADGATLDAANDA